MPERILIVEDEPAILESVAFALRREGFEVRTAATCSAARELLEGCDLVVLDLMLPDGDGLDLLRSLRQKGTTTAVIVLSSRDAEPDRIAALETGADDYVTKPFSPREVGARVRAVLRRTASANRTPILDRAPPVSVDRDTRRASVNRQGLDLTRVEFDLLATMLESPGRVFTRSELIDRVWGDGFALADRTVDTHIKLLRRKLADAGGNAGWIETVRGVGYRVTDANGCEESTAS